MSEKIKLLAHFENIEFAADGMDVLDNLGITNQDIEVVSGAPISPAMLGRHHVHTNVPKYAMGGAIFGALVGIFLAYGTPNLYKLYVGGKPLTPGGPSIILFFEMTMLFMLISTFLGVFFESGFPSYEKKEYVPEISDGKIALMFEVEPSKELKFVQALQSAGADYVRTVERQQP